MSADTLDVATLLLMVAMQDREFTMNSNFGHAFAAKSLEGRGGFTGMRSEVNSETAVIQCVCKIRVVP